MKQNTPFVLLLLGVFLIFLGLTGRLGGVLAAIFEPGILGKNTGDGGPTLGGPPMIPPPAKAEPKAKDNPTQEEPPQSGTPEGPVEGPSPIETPIIPFPGNPGADVTPPVEDPGAIPIPPPEPDPRKIIDLPLKPPTRAPIIDEPAAAASSGGSWWETVGGWLKNAASFVEELPL